MCEEIYPTVFSSFEEEKLKLKIQSEHIFWRLDGVFF